MIPILSSEQISDVDRITIEREPITSIDLMWRAARKCSDWITAHVTLEREIAIFCGTGNNGGDGLVIASHLKEAGYSVSVYVVRFSNQESKDFSHYLDALSKRFEAPKNIEHPRDVPPIGDATVVIDAIFGNGISRPAEGIARECIMAINASQSMVISIDMPSGLYADRYPEPNTSIVKAWMTLTFQLPKLSLLLPFSGQFTQEFDVLDIELDSTAIEKTETHFIYLDSISCYRQHFIRGRFTHKGSFGHVLVVAGKRGAAGAAIMCADASVRSGAGLVTAAVPKVGVIPMQVAVPDAMVVENGADYFDQVPELEPFSAVIAGPGLGQQGATEEALIKLLKVCRAPIVLDADALNILSKNKAAMKSLPKNSILTPHPKEFERLFGSSKNDFERIECLRHNAVELNVTIVLKGANTAIATPDGKVCFNSTGNSGLATGGTGDVLSGIIAGFLAQGNDAKVSALCGVYLHGMAADIAIETKSPQALAASDLMSTFGQAMKKALHL